MSEFIVDGAILSILAVFAVYGFVSGFTGRLFGVGSWILSGVLAFYLYPLLTPHLQPLLKNQSLLLVDILSAALIFVIFLGLSMWASKTLSSSVKKSKVGSVDRNLGIVLGLVLGIFFLSILALGIRFFIEETAQPEAFESSKLWPWVNMCSDKICTVLPVNLSQHPDPKEKKKQREQALKNLTVLNLKKTPQTTRPKPQVVDEVQAPSPTPVYDVDERQAMNDLIQSMEG